MFITTDYSKRYACYNAVLEVLKPMGPGETVTLDGMSCEDRIIHLDVVRALIHTARKDTDRNFRTSVQEDCSEIDDGWTKTTTTIRRLHVTCTGMA